ncbi:MAG: hypothetical protein ACC649_02215 [Myxococcota bacterium]
MADSSEGIRRLSLFVGSIVVILCLVRIVLSSDFFSEMNYLIEGSIIYTVLVVLWFLVPWPFVRGVAWVIGGFTREKDQPRKDSMARIITAMTVLLVWTWVLPAAAEK